MPAQTRAEFHPSSGKRLAYLTLALTATLAIGDPAFAQTGSGQPHAAAPAPASTGQTVPGKAPPPQTVPAQTMPAQTAPAQTAPAQAAPTATVPAQTSPAAPPTAPEPQRTTATFGDWILRCVRPERTAPTCEMAQLWSERGSPVAQLAIGRPPSEPMRITLLVPPNVRLTVKPRVLGGERETAAAAVELNWQRCLPAACVADAVLNDEQIQRLRSRSENGRVVFQDAAGREATLPLVPRGLAQGLDALAREERAAAAH